MALIAANIFPNVSRHSNAARAAAEQSNAEAALLLNQPLTAAGVATATTTSKAKTVNTLTYLIAGVFFSKGATDNFWTLSGTTVAASSWQKYLLLIDSSGAASIQEGTQSLVSAAAVSWTNVTGVSRWGPLLSVLNAGKCIVSTLTIATDATHTFVPGTTLLGAAGITATFVDGMDQSLLPLIANTTGTLLGLGG